MLMQHSQIYIRLVSETINDIQMMPLCMCLRVSKYSLIYLINHYRLCHTAQVCMTHQTNNDHQ